MAIRYCTSCRAIYRQEFQNCPVDGGPLVIEETDPWLGAEVGGHYTIDAFIGEGAMGRVYRAYRTDLPDRRYAIKILIGDLAATDKMRARFQAEAEHASKLAHPNLVGVVDYGASCGVPYIVMDLVEGPSLGSLVMRAPLSPTRVIKLARQLCEGLEHAHGRGMIHRDFKPDNILVVGHGDLEVARIADFGLALSTQSATRLTTTGIVCTPAYAAPEQLRGHAIDHRVDLYALGTTMYEMLSGGLLPFPGELDASVRAKLMNDAPSVLLVAPNVPPALVSILGRLLASDPGRRPRDARAVIRALDAALAAPRAVMRTAQVAPLTDAHAEPAPRRSTFGRTLVQLFACGITFGGALALFGLRGPTSPAPIAQAAPAPAIAPVSVPFAAPTPVVEPTVEPIVEPIVEPTVEPLVMTIAVEPVVLGSRSSPPVRVVGKPRTAVDPLVRQHAEVGRDLRLLDQRVGRENTDDLWVAYHAIQLVDRGEAAAELSEIRDAITDRGQLP